MPKGKYQQRLIPRKLMQKGIDLCKANIADFLNDAKLIMAEGRMNHAYIMVEFAIEEIGKIVMIKEAFDQDPHDPFRVKGEVFGTHRGKSEKAWEVLDPKFRLIFDEGRTAKGLFVRGMWQNQEDVEANHKTRCECAFVDFVGESIWIVGTDIKKNLLENLINHIEEKLRGM